MVSFSYIRIRNTIYNYYDNNN